MAIDDMWPRVATLIIWEKRSDDKMVLVTMYESLPGLTYWEQGC